jgi:hypothetical protein
LNRVGHVPGAILAGHAADLQVRHDGILQRTPHFVEFA